MLVIKEFTKCLLEQQTEKILIRLLLQKQSDLGLHCLTKPFWQATSVPNFRTFTVDIKDKISTLCTLLDTIYFDELETKDEDMVLSPDEFIQAFDNIHVAYALHSFFKLIVR